MRRKLWLGISLSILAFSLISTSSPQLAHYSDDDDRSRFRHVLLISVDGLHAVDLANFIKTNPASTLAKLAHQGLSYSNASSPRPSDSFPGLLALVTGGTPNSTGVWYDDSYDRSLAPPDGPCTPGAEIVYDETVDFNPNALDAGGGINPALLPRDPAGGCTHRVFPHEFLRVNTIFEVIKHAGGRTAWSDKHPAYDLVNGPSGTGVDDLFTPEINAATAIGVITDSIADTEAYDDIKVSAIINELNGFDHTGVHHVGVPRILGMNFQAVSVGQKLPTDPKTGKAGGYADLLGTPNAGLADALAHTDASLGKMEQALKDNGLLENTLVIVSAKHGQSPIDINKLQKLNGATSRPSKILSPSGDAAQVTEDDISLVWLKNSSTLSSDLASLEANLASARIQKIFAGESLKLVFNDPANDPRVPDIIVQPELGVIYSGNATKIAEHGGFSEDDTHVALLLSNPGLRSAQIKSPVETMQVAPTILWLLGLDPQALKAVRLERTALLPGLPQPSD